MWKLLTNTVKISLRRHKLISINRFYSETKQSNGHFDVIIIGGGGAGLSLAGAISKNSFLCDKRVLLLDGAPKFKGYNKDLYSNRVFSINENTVNLMKNIGAWETIKSIRYQPVKQMQVWDGISDALIQFNDDEFVASVAYVVENEVLLYAIDKEIEKNSNVEIRNDSRIEKVNLQCNGAPCNEVHLKSGEMYTSTLLIGADGANSMVRKEMGVDFIGVDYKQMGLIATLEFEEADNNVVAWQRFLPNGIIALLPLSDRLSSIVWSTEVDIVKSLIKMSENEFIDAVNHAFVQKFPKQAFINEAMRGLASILGQDHTTRQLPPKVHKIYHNSRAAFPLGFGHASTYVRQGVALIGDAAHRVHPLAGMGLNLGFGDVKALTDTLASAAYDGLTLNDLDILNKYETTQLRNNVPIMLGIHGLQRLYGTDITPIVLARSLGLQITQTLTPLKKFFMQRAMG